jgi:hypothetical protein
MPDTPADKREQRVTSALRDTGPTSSTSTHPSRPDPRRPDQKQTRETNENTRPGRESSQSSTGSSISKLEEVDKGSSEWEVLSDAGSRLNEGDVADVEELQKKVDKRYVP